MPPSQYQQPDGIGLRWGQTGDPVMERPLRAAMLAPRAFEAKNLLHPRPIEVVVQIAGGEQLAPLHAPAVATLHRARHPPIMQGRDGNGRWRIEEEGNILMESPLVLLDQQQV